MPLRYSSSDPVRRRRALKRLAARVPLRPLARFVYLYFFKRGFLDGRPGLIFCLLRAAQEIHIVAKLAEAHRTASRSPLTIPRARGPRAPRWQ